MTDSTESRFATFLPVELRSLWESMVLDDGLEYGHEEGTTEHRLLRELEDEMRSRRISPPGGREYMGRPRG